MLITLADGSRTVQCSISEVGLSTKPARSQEKLTEAPAVTGLAGDPLA